jgi:hypothetical protein
MMAQRLFALAAALLIASAGVCAQDLAAFFDGSIKFLEHLKTCTPFTFTYEHPFVPGAMAEHSIKGKEGNGCHVVYVVPTGQKNEVITRDCHLSDSTIALMTTEEKFKELRDWVTRGSTSDPVNVAMDRECQDSEPGPRRRTPKDGGPGLP